MSGEKRETGINIIGDAPWGTHFCQFYQAKEDLIDILVPYFKRGLENNEFCMWVTSEPLGVEEAKASLRKVVRNLDEYIKKGQIEILDHTEWYIKSGKFDADEVLQGWVEKERQALERGFDGLRLTGNTFWLERNDWKDFVDYEAKVDSVIGNYRMMAVCTYSLDKCGAPEIMDVISNHQFALVRRQGKWDLIESTERKRAEESLRQERDRAQKYLDVARVMLVAIDAERKVTLINKRGCEVLGCSEKEIIGKGWFDTFLPERFRGEVKAVFDKLMAGEIEPVEYFENPIFTKSGEERIIAWHNILLTDERGSIIGTLSSGEDITERKQAEETLRESRDYLERLTNSMWDAVFEVKMPERVIEWANDSFKLIGYDPGECIGKTTEFLYPDESEFLDFGNKLKNVIAAGKDILHAEQLLKRKSGEVFPAEITATISKEKGEIVRVTSIVRDITERKQAEEMLRESKELFEKTFVSQRDAIFVLDAGIPPTILECNSAATNIFGYTHQEIRGRTTDFLHIDEAALRKFQQHLYLAIDQHGFLHLLEFSMRRKDGTIFPSEHTVAPLKDEQGKRIGWVSVVRDITERKQAEEREKKLQQELYLSSRLASIGELAAGVAHEINNPLTGILGFSQRLLRKSTDEKVSQDLEVIHNEALRAAKVVENLLTFARRREPTKEYSDINDIVQKALELRAYELKTGNIEVTLGLTPSLPKPIADFQQIQEVFLNIILNAEQVMTEANHGGKLTIKTQEIKDYIRISFTDDGPGIPAEHLDKVFDPFFTTREEGGGTGLGLSVCHGIVTGHGGRIYARSKPGKGATFIVELPVITEEADKSRIVEA